MTRSAIVPEVEPGDGQFHITNRVGMFGGTVLCSTCFHIATSVPGIGVITTLTMLSAFCPIESNGSTSRYCRNYCSSWYLTSSKLMTEWT
jgi:hypothetical protein